MSRVKLIVSVRKKQRRRRLTVLQMHTLYRMGNYCIRMCIRFLFAVVYENRRDQISKDIHRMTTDQMEQTRRSNVRKSDNVRMRKTYVYVRRLKKEQVCKLTNVK